MTYDAGGSPSSTAFLYLLIASLESMSTMMYGEVQLSVDNVHQPDRITSDQQGMEFLDAFLDSTASGMTHLILRLDSDSDLPSTLEASLETLESGLTSVGSEETAGAISFMEDAEDTLILFNGESRSLPSPPTEDSSITVPVA